MGLVVKSEVASIESIVFTKSVDIKRKAETIHVGIPLL